MLFINEYVHITITILILASCLCSVVSAPQVLTRLAYLTQSTTYCFTTVLPEARFELGLQVQVMKVL